jgi:hypothetical protein
MIIDNLYQLAQKEFKEKKETCVVTPCWNGVFHNVDCLEDETQYGFYNSDNDIRPGWCVWVRKDKAELIFEAGKREAQKETAEKVEKLKEELFYGDYLHFNNAEKKVISNVFNKIFNEDKK